MQHKRLSKKGIILFVFRLEMADKDWHSKMDEEKKKVTDLEAILQEERSKLEQTTSELHSAETEVQSLTGELEGLHHRVKALEEAVGQLQEEVQKGRTELKERESEERRLCLNVEQLETDLRSSKALTESLQSELHEKEAKEVEMLVEREQAVAQVILHAFFRPVILTVLLIFTVHTFTLMYIYLYIQYRHSSIVPCYNEFYGG